MLVRQFVVMSGGPSNVCSFAACLFQERGDLNDPRSFPQARNVAFPAASNCSSDGGMFTVPFSREAWLRADCAPSSEETVGRAALVRAPLSQTGSTPCWGQIARTIVEEILAPGALGADQYVGQPDPSRPRWIRVASFWMVWARPWATSRRPIARAAARPGPSGIPESARPEV
jgi:hypothetical protein